jgi:hypothetical protein
MFSQKIYIMERNIRTYDLSSPIQAFQFATFLLRLREQSKELETLFGNKKAEFVARAGKNELTEWTRRAQPDKFPPTPTSTPAPSPSPTIQPDTQTGQVGETGIHSVEVKK